MSIVSIVPNQISLYVRRFRANKKLRSLEITLGVNTIHYKFTNVYGIRWWHSADDFYRLILLFFLRTHMNHIFKQSATRSSKFFLLAWNNSHRDRNDFNQTLLIYELHELLSIINFLSHFN